MQTLNVMNLQFYDADLRSKKRYEELTRIQANGIQTLLDGMLRGYFCLIKSKSHESAESLMTPLNWFAKDHFLYLLDIVDENAFAERALQETPK